MGLIVDMSTQLATTLLLAQVVHRYDAGHAGITALAVTPEDCFLAGCQDGYMLAFAPRPQGIHPKFNLGAAPMQSTHSEDSKSPSQQSQ